MANGGLWGDDGPHPPTEEEKRRAAGYPASPAEHERASPQALEALRAESGMSYKRYSALGIIEQLKFWRDLPKGSTLPTDWPNIGEWDTHIRKVVGKAIDEIEWLRKIAGATSRGPTFEDYYARQGKRYGDDRYPGKTD